MPAISMTSAMRPSVSHHKMEGPNASRADSRAQKRRSPDHQLHQGLWLKMKGRFYTENSRRARKTFSIPERKHEWTVGEPDVHLMSFSSGPSNVLTLLPGGPAWASFVKLLPAHIPQCQSLGCPEAWIQKKAFSKTKTSSWSQ